MPFAPKRASRTGIIGPSILIALATVIVGYAALWLADLAFKIDFRFWIVALKLMSAKQFLIFLIYLVPFTAFFVIALHVLHRNFSHHGCGARRALPDQYPGADARLHRAAGPAIRHRCG